ncbi:uncharacterized protein LOC126892374 [Diabrotica virgifera virgifera]|uniref:Uncharacterized protein LOC114346708 n=1 Tax=Diabrotica virgifera virgifera TaxID=50390 RepID=A0A6P7H410_DIAVI|nr:uncharacterized protein LOC126892374 [Diabrotica virgifera virgifera]
MFHMYWPATCAITLFLIVGVIMVMLKWGPRLCKLRHTALPDRGTWQHATYEQPISYA